MILAITSQRRWVGGRPRTIEAGSAAAFGRTRSDVAVTWSARTSAGEEGQRTLPKGDAQDRAGEAAANADRELAELRDAIDAVDREILAQLNRRAGLVREVGELKARGGVAPVYVASRERDLVASLVEANPGPFPSAGIPHVFREIVSATRSLEQVVRIAYLGPAGTFSHQAAMRQFGGLVDLVEARTIPEVFDLTERGRAHFGIVPVENAIEGVVTVTYDSLVDSEVTICGELHLPITQTLLARSRTLPEGVKVASHPQGLAQCRNWLQTHLPDAELVQTASTAAAAELAASDPQIAAIASEVAAQAYDLEIVEASVEDRKGNSTRFFVIGTERPTPSGSDHTSAVFTVSKNQSGALYHLLEPFATHSVNLTAVQSRPIKGKPWEYLFFVDMEGHIGDAAVARALDDAAAYAHSHKILGSYPSGVRKQAAYASSAHSPAGEPIAAAPVRGGR